MSETSDCEEFYDAEDITPSRKKRDSISKSALSPSYGSIKAGEESKVALDSVDSQTKRGDVEESIVPLPPPEPQRPDFRESIETFKIPLPSKKSVEELHEGRKKFRDLRRQLQADDEELGTNPSPPDSQTSSVEGVFPNQPSKTSHPFRIIQHDGVSIHSMTSLGRVGRILSGSDASGIRDGTSSTASTPVSAGPVLPVRDISPATSVPSVGSASLPFLPSARIPSPVSAGPSTIPARDRSPVTSGPGAPRDLSPGSGTLPLPYLEPDVIASAKNSKAAQKQLQQPSTSKEIAVPVAPPRKKKKKEQSTPVEKENMVLTTLESLTRDLETSLDITSLKKTRDLETSLDINSLKKGQYVVKPQDEEKSKAEGEPEVVIPVVPVIQQASIFIGNKERLVHLPAPQTSNSIGRTSINSAKGLSMSHFTGHGGSEAGGSSGSGCRLKVSPRGSKERRRSAGDEQAVCSQLNMFVRTRTDSGKQLSDLEILEQVTVLNLDTGERVPLSVAEDKLPQGINPLSLHIMRLTSEYVSNPSLQDKESDEESVDSKMTESVVGENLLRDRAGIRKKTDKLKKFLGTTVRKTMDKAKSIAQEVSHSRREDMVDMGDELSPGETYIKLKASSSHKGPYDFDSLQMVQDLSGQHEGPVWCMKFSTCGRLLATAGQDRVVRVWVLRSAYQHFQDMRTKYNAEKVSPTPSQESLVSQQSAEEPPMDMSGAQTGPFMPRPLCTYTGHTSDLLDLSWSKNYFVLSSSMDKTVRLWHISRKECLCCFQHIDFVTAIVFHPKDDRYFLSGSLDGKLRLWNIPDKKVAVWNELSGQTKLITAANFCQNGKFAVVGSYDGRCIFYKTDQLKYHTTIHVRSSRGKNATGRKISGVEPMPGEDKILVTSNDSRIRLYDLQDLNLSCKYKGYVNVSSQIKASFSHDGKYIVSGSENQCLYVWKTHHDYFKFSSVRRDRNDFWEGVKAHNAAVTCAVFAPHPDIILHELRDTASQSTEPPSGYALVSADFNGCIKVFVNKMKPKHSSLPASALA